MSKYICIHGHFYQPPRENPWLGEIELQESAYPFHDWNERITAECYDPNARSRILDHNRKIISIVNNYSKISFNFGPTLLSWMELKNPEAYELILEADKIGQKNFSGHGTAIAQVYNHLIMPLANKRDKETQIIWGIEDFRYRFGRHPEGMWLAETAVDTESLELLAKHDIKFTILAPIQAKAIKSLKAKEWHTIHNDDFDTTIPYLYQLPSGKTITLFFYHGGLSQAIAFDGLLNNGESFANKLSGAFHKPKTEKELIHVATDGESYGHHHHHGDMALAFCLHKIEKGDIADLTVYGEYLEKTAPTMEVQIRENSSWSCYHGIGRWKENCGCHTGGRANWNQSWRKPLRDALDQLRDAVIPLYEKEMKAYHNEPWEIRNKSIELILNRHENAEEFIRENFKAGLTDDEVSSALRLIDLQLNAQLMFTSCGWFFDEISGIETVQILRYAGRVLQICETLGRGDLKKTFLDTLETATSNIYELKNGKVIYTRFVEPSVVDFLRLGAHFAFRSLYKELKDKINFYCYAFQTQGHDKLEAGRSTLVWGKGLAFSVKTLRYEKLSYVLLHLSDHNFICGVGYLTDEAKFEKFHADVENLFQTGNFSEVIEKINQTYEQTFNLWDLFKREQQMVINAVLETAMDNIHNSFTQIYNAYYPLIQIQSVKNISLPKPLTTVIEFVLSEKLIKELESNQPNGQKIETLIQQMQRLEIRGDVKRFEYVINAKIVDLMEMLQNTLIGNEIMQTIIFILKNAKRFDLDLDLWKAQNIYFEIGCDRYEAEKKLDSKDSKKWVELFETLGEYLEVRIN